MIFNFTVLMVWGIGCFLSVFVFIAEKRKRNQMKNDKIKS